MNHRGTFVQVEEKADGTQIYRRLSQLSAKEMAVPAGYIPQAVWAERNGLTSEQAAKLAGYGRLWVTKDIAATMKVGYYRFIHINAVVREPMQFQTGNNRKN